MENFFNVGDSNLIQSTLFPTHLKKLFKFWNKVTILFPGIFGIQTITRWFKA
jgi:hypothetical protein